MQGEVRQALARPNPQVELTAENIGGSGQHDGVDQSESTLLFAQRLELGGKRRRRGEVAARALHGETARLRERESQAVASAATLFFELLGAQAEADLAAETAAHAAAAVGDLRRRRTAGAASAVDVERARLLTARADIDAAQRHAEVAIARQRLAATWGGRGQDIDRVRGSLQPLPALPSPQALEARLAASPAMMTAAAQSARMRAELDLQRAQAVPDIVVGGGVRYLAGPEDVAFVAETGVEVPLFDRRRGAIEAAQWRTRRSERDAAATAASVRDTVGRARLEMEAADAQIEQLQARHLPVARASLAELERGYGLGTATSFDLLEARRTLLDLRIQHVRALVAYHRAAIAIEGVLGWPMQEMPASDAPPQGWPAHEMPVAQPQGWPVHEIPAARAAHEGDATCD